MFFTLSKILSFLLFPFSWVILFFFFSLFAKNPIRKKKYFLTTLFILLFFSNTFIFDAFMRAWEYPATRSSELTGQKIAVMLTGMTSYSPAKNRIEFNDRSDRLMQTIDLFHQGKISKIILCGGNGTLLANDAREFTELHSYLIRNCIPDSILIDEFVSRNTFENALNTESLLSESNEKDTVILITSAYHMKRALACFVKQEIKVIPYATDYYSGPIKFELDYLFLPSAGTMMNWEKLFHEWFGCMIYKLTGKI